MLLSEDGAFLGQTLDLSRLQFLAGWDFVVASSAAAKHLNSLHPNPSSNMP